MSDDVVRLLSARKGHFRLESGHHGELWLDLELLCLNQEPVRRVAVQLAARLAHHDIDAVCGPLVEGAFVALMVASELAVPFTYAERLHERPGDPAGRVHPVRYRIPGALRAEVRGKRVALVDDVINTGSAVRATLGDLEDCGAAVAAIGALAVMGEWARAFTSDRKLPLEAMAFLPNEVWAPADCPLCARKVPLTHAVASTR